MAGLAMKQSRWMARKPCAAGCTINRYTAAGSPAADQSTPCQSGSCVVSSVTRSPLQARPHTRSVQRASENHLHTTTCSTKGQAKESSGATKDSSGSTRRMGTHLAQYTDAFWVWPSKEQLSGDEKAVHGVVQSNVTTFSPDFSRTVSAIASSSALVSLPQNGSGVGRAMV